MGKDGSKWKHDYIPLNAAATALKMHRAAGGKSGKGGAHQSFLPVPASFKEMLSPRWVAPPVMPVTVTNFASGTVATPSVSFTSPRSGPSPITYWPARRPPLTPGQYSCAIRASASKEMVKMFPAVPGVTRTSAFAGPYFVVPRTARLPSEPRCTVNLSLIHI